MVCNKPVSAARNRFDVSGDASGIVQGFAEFVDRGVEAVIEVAESVSRPEEVAELFASDEMAGILDQEGEDFQGWAGEVDLVAVLPEFVGVGVEKEGAEGDKVSLIPVHFDTPTSIGYEEWTRLLPKG
jgi:hypothetical protein